MAVVLKLMQNFQCGAGPCAAGMICPMCYSAMVEQETKRLGMKFNVRVQLDMFDDIFTRRSQGEKVAINKAMENQFLVDPASPVEKHIAEMIIKWRNDQVSLCESELFKQQKRISDAERVLKTKATKKALDEVRIATNKISQIQFKLKKLRTSDYVSEDEKSVFPMTYLSMILAGRDGRLNVAPFRYHMRPFGQSELFDRKYNGCYNARKDNLSNPFWKPVFGKRHGLIVVKKFYEHVPVEDYAKKFPLPENLKKNNSIILGFEPEGMEYMLIPTLWDINKHKGKPDLYSCALITDDPPLEVAETGHNRCPIFLKEENVDRWLHPEGRSLEELYAILDDRQTPYYRHSLVTAA